MTQIALCLLSLSFSVDPIGVPTSLSNMISVQPKKGSLTTTEKPVNVHVYFRAKKEVRIEQQPILRCQVGGDCTPTEGWGGHQGCTSVWPAE